MLGKTLALFLRLPFFCLWNLDILRKGQSIKELAWSLAQRSGDFQEKIEGHALAEIEQQPDRFLVASDRSRKKRLVSVEVFLEDKMYPGCQLFLDFVQFFLHNAKLHIGVRILI